PAEDGIRDFHVTGVQTCALPIFAIHNLFQVHPEAHARFHALSRAYVYRISLQKDVFNYEGSYYFKQHLDVAKMQKASKLLLGHKDFQCFSKSNTDVKTYYCNIMDAEWTLVDHELRSEEHTSELQSRENLV